MIEVNINSALKVNTSNITGGTSGRIFYEKLDNTLGQVPGFSYDETTTTLAYQDTVRGITFFVGEGEYSPGIYIPIAGTLVEGRGFMGFFDLTTIGSAETFFMGYDLGDKIVVEENELRIRSNNFRLESQDLSNILFESTGTQLAFFGVPPVGRQTISANPTNAEIATVLNNIGIAEII